MTLFGQDLSDRKNIEFSTLWAWSPLLCKMVKIRSPLNIFCKQFPFSYRMMGFCFYQRGEIGWFSKWSLSTRKVGCNEAVNNWFVTFNNFLGYSWKWWENKIILFSTFSKGLYSPFCFHNSKFFWEAYK